MNILMLTENDPAGMAIAFCRAINAFTKHSCRLISTDERYGINFAKDIHLPDRDGDCWDDIEVLLKHADIIHFHILSDESMKLGPFTVNDYIQGKTLVHHHHGHPDFRSHPEKYREKYRRLGRKTLVSTPDLLMLLPEAAWMPNTVPVNDERFMPSENGVNGKVRICQAPTRKDLKNTREFIEITSDLKQTYPQIERFIIENTVYDTCLSIKRSCDIHFDHMQGYYGVSSLESLSQGKPVIAGIDEWNETHIKEFTGCRELPWVIARNKDQLRDQLTRLISDHELRREKGKESREFMTHHWSDRIVAGKLSAFYQSL